MTTLSDGTTLFFNFYTLALIALDSSEAEVAQSLLSNPSQRPKKKKNLELKRLLADKGFLIDQRVDEPDLLRASHFTSRIQQAHLSLTIAPTLQCNFSCSYCYQGKNLEQMNPEVEKQIAPFVKEHLKKKGALSVAWYGGEPLLRLETIERLSKEFIALCREAEAEYSASIITNAFLLEPEIAEQLLSWNVTNAQITLDGPPEIHESRRPLRGGGKTFHKILANIRSAPPEMRISLRMNVDERNKEHIAEILDILAKEGLQNKVSFYLGQTYPYTDVCRDVSSWCLSDESFSLLSLQTALELVPRGFGPMGIPTSKNYSCMADKENAVVITPSGGLVKCWNEIIKPEAEIGHLLKPASTAAARNIERWRCRDPFQLECAQCQLLPICMGGCPYLYARLGKLDCHPWKHHLRESVCMYYYIQKVKQETEIVKEFRELVDYVKENAQNEEKERS
jgi:uncharacterized protein